MGLRLGLGMELGSALGVGVGLGLGVGSVKRLGVGAGWGVPTEMQEKETKIQTGSVAQCMRKAKGRFVTPKPARNHLRSHGRQVGVGRA